MCYVLQKYSSWYQVMWDSQPAPHQTQVQHSHALGTARMPLAPVKEGIRETLYQDVRYCCCGGCPKEKNIRRENNQGEVNLINASLWLFLFFQIDRKWNLKRKRMWAITPKVWALRCVCASVYELKDTDKAPLCRHTHFNAQLRIILGCAPNANLKSTNTHGTQQRGRKRRSEERASGYYAWNQVLCGCILKCGPGLVTDTMCTAKRLFNWTEVKRSPDGFNRRYALEGHIPICLSLHLRTALSPRHIFLLRTFIFTSLTLFLQIPSTLLTFPFAVARPSFIVIIPDLTHTSWCLHNHYIHPSYSFMIFFFYQQHSEIYFPNGLEYLKVLYLIIQNAMWNINKYQHPINNVWDLNLKWCHRIQPSGQEGSYHKCPTAIGFLFRVTGAGSSMQWRKHLTSRTRPEGENSASRWGLRRRTRSHGTPYRYQWQPWNS